MAAVSKDAGGPSRRCAAQPILPRIHHAVMAGLDPAIHVFFANQSVIRKTSVIEFSSGH
jgi:hypothetical protein